MSSVESNIRHLWKLFIYVFNVKKSVAEAHLLLVEAYGDATLSKKICSELFYKFKNGEFNNEDKERSRKL